MFLFKELKADSSLMRRISLICNLSFTLSCAKMEGETKLIYHDLSTRHVYIQNWFHNWNVHLSVFEESFESFQCRIHHNLHNLFYKLHCY